MRIKLLRTIGKKDTMGKGGENPASKELPAKPDGKMYQEGEVAEFSAADSEKLIKFGMGVETTEPVGPAPPAPLFGAAPIPVVVVPHQPPATPPASKDKPK